MHKSSTKGIAMKKNRLAVLIAVFFLFVPVLSHVSADSFYEGKRIRFLVHAPPGGGCDLNSRLLVRHMANHIPGKPSIIVQNMPGATVITCTVAGAATL